MASVNSTPLARRKKQTVYGKSSNTPFSPAGTAFFEDDEAAWMSNNHAPRKSTTVMPTRPAKTARSEPPAQPKPQAPTKKPGALPKTKKSPPRVKDTYDVPSDDEDTEGYSQIPFPPKQRIQSRLLDEPKEDDEQLAPWEKKATRKTGTLNSKTTNSSRSKAAKALEERLMGLQRASGETQEIALDKSKSDKCEPDAPESVRMTALQRLAARRKQAQSTDSGKVSEHEDTVKEPPKRSAVKASSQEAPQSKRRRMTPQPSSPPVKTIDSEPSPATKMVSETAKVKDDGDIFDVPSDDEPTQPVKPAVRKTIRMRQRTPGAGMLRKITPQKGLSAPSRLEDMLVDEDVIDSLVVEYGSPGTPDAPQTALRDSAREPPSTPIPGGSSSSQGQRLGTLTPKQTQLWADLLEPAVIPNTDMKKLSITEDMMERKPKKNAPATLQRSSSDVPARRTRIVDRLKASAPNSSDEESSEDEEDKSSFSMPVAKPAAYSNTVSQESNSLSQAEESQDRATKPTASGSLITYSQQRSILADDNLESALMLDLAMDTPERPTATARRIGRPAAASRATSHMDEDLDDAPTGGLRTIHELRAGGRNARIMGEIEDLLGEIRDHATSARSRRRGALLDLTTKLQEKTFAEQIISHGFDHALLKECKSPADPPADFLLATSLLLLLHSEPPKHSLDSFGEALRDISRLLTEQADIAKVVKERRSNMSRSAQGDIIALSDKLKENTALWGDASPIRVSSRVVVLKIIELVVRRLRQAGNKSELFSSETLNALTPNRGFSGLQNDAGKAFEASLVISILEALKTRSASENWPDTSIAFVAALPAAFATEWPAPGHTKWLAYRLCANITNDSSDVRSAFVENDAVRYLMADVVTGLEILQNPPATENGPDEDSTRDFDNLVLVVGTLINLTEHSADAQKRAVDAKTLPSLTAVVQAFLEGQKRSEEAESVEQSAANVAYGYLSIMLANLCQNDEAKQTLRSLLPGGTLRVLVAAVEEFVRHHQRVDGMEASGPDSEWSSFTDRLLGVLVRLKAAAGEDMEGVQS